MNTFWHAYHKFFFLVVLQIIFNTGIENYQVMALGIIFSLY